ncbi:terpene cyclase [Aspergillus tubingensis]|uniref:Terpene cyclase n=1 Tax=Aspergillus tubingensis TaxID=5068 RepID=A0A9W6AXK3_ASPTU|nr:terpene cyclase [Aspergillus tubingensis]GLA89004.1 terpene cyclase [Aspergillus tubingensis]GLA99233.1 terpene cyclase [Aspergillus tubingensis]
MASVISTDPAVVVEGVVPPFNKADQQPVEDVTSEQFKGLLAGLLENMGISPLEEQRPCDDLAMAIYARLGPVLPEEHQAFARAVCKVGALVGIYFYPCHSEFIQRLIGVYTAVYLVLDDLGHTMVDSIAQYRQQLVRPNSPVAGASEEPPTVFSLLTSLFEEFDREFPTACANKLFASVVNSLASLELEYDESTIFSSVASPTFPKYFRNMNGSSEAYVYFLLPHEVSSMSRLKRLLQAVPELLDITDEINDLFSFYKESVVGLERETFVYQKARVDGSSAYQTLQMLSGEILRRERLIQCILQSDPVLAHLASMYIRGQIAFYLSSERYRLSELAWIA